MALGPAACVDCGRSGRQRRWVAPMRRSQRLVPAWAGWCMENGLAHSVWEQRDNDEEHKENVGQIEASDVESIEHIIIITELMTISTATLTIDVQPR